jgi:hypothetical protein
MAGHLRDNPGSGQIQDQVKLRIRSNPGSGQTQDQVNENLFVIDEVYRKFRKNQLDSLNRRVSNRLGEAEGRP